MVFTTFVTYTAEKYLLYMSYLCFYLIFLFFFLLLYMIASIAVGIANRIAVATAATGPVPPVFGIMFAPSVTS